MVAFRSHQRAKFSLTSDTRFHFLTFLLCCQMQLVMVRHEKHTGLKEGIKSTWFGFNINKYVVASCLAFYKQLDK